MKTIAFATMVVLGILLFGSLGLSGAGRDPLRMPNDSDGDGVPDPLDLCPQENASFFDRDGDGCIDDPVSARHTEYWAPDQMPFTYYIHEGGAPGVGDGSDFAAIQNGMSAWAAIPGVDFSVSYGGTTSQAVAAALDQVNLVTFSDNQYQFGAAVLAVGISTSFTVDSVYNGTQYRPGQIVDADMIFNPLKKWRTPTAGTQGTDIRSVATHEAAHLFGIAHSPVRTSTMFYVLPPGTEAASLETEDELVFFKAYPEAGALAAASRLDGSVLDGSTNAPVPGAIVCAIDAASGDTVAADYTMPDGSFCFVGLPDGQYYVAIHALDGSSTIGYLKPAYINSLVDTTAVTAFVAEYWDLAESNTDDAAAKDVVTIGPAAPPGALAIVTNIDSTPPEVVSITPAASMDSVSIDAAVVITFSEPIDYTTISGNFRILDAAAGTFISGSATVLRDDSVIAFTPYGLFQFETAYELSLETGLTDKNGVALATEFQSNFVTEPLPPLAVMNLSPSKGVGGSIVIVNGAGFSWTASANTVRFGSMEAPVLDAFPNRLIVMVPAGASTGLVTVETGGETSNGLTFTVLSAFEIARGYETGVTELGALPRAITVLPDGGWAYVATDIGAAAVIVDPGRSGYLTVTSIPMTGGFVAVEATPDGKRVYAANAVMGRLCTIDTDPSHGLLFNTIIAEHSVGCSPIGIAVDPNGGRAYVATDVGGVQVWDIRSGSLTYERHIGELAPGESGLRGALAVDPAGSRLLAPTDRGTLLVFDLGGDSLLAEIPVLGDPQDVVVDPAGQRAYVSDGTGNVTVVSITGLFRVQDINTGGSLRGMTLTPGGGYLYATNRQLDLIDVIDLKEESPTFRSVAATIAIGSNPVDVARSPDGFYAFSVVQGTRQLIVTTIGLGPTLASLSRRAGPPGAKLVLAGTGFGVNIEELFVEFPNALDPAHPIRVIPEYSSGTAIAAAVPRGAGSGPVKVVRVPWNAVPGSEAHATAQEEGEQFSNALYFQVLDGSSGTGTMRHATGIGMPPLFELTNELAFSPTGDFVLVGGYDGKAAILDTDPESATFNQFLRTMDVSSELLEDMTLTPDGERAYFAVRGLDSIPCFNMNRHSPGFGDFMGAIWVPTIYINNRIAVSPSGELLLVTAGDSLCAVDIVPGSTRENEIIGVAMNHAMPDALGFHPGGRHAYFATAANVLGVLDIDPLSPRYLEVIGSVTMPDTLTIRRFVGSFSFTPDGARCLVVTVAPELAQEAWCLFVLDTSDPGAPVIEQRIDFPCQNNIRAMGAVDVSPQGDRAIAGLGFCAYYTVDLLSEPMSIIDTHFDWSNISTMNMDFTPDGSRLYATAPYATEDSIFVYDFSNAADIVAVSGDMQSGVIGQPLPAPLRVFVSEPGLVPVPVPGVLVNYRVIDGGGHFTQSGLVTQTVATDQAGFAELDWTLGDEIGEQTQIVEVRAIGLMGSPLYFVAHSYPDPESLPLTLSQTAPLDGSGTVSVTSAVQAVFSKAVQQASISSSTFSLRRTGAAEGVPANTGFADGDRRVALIPLAALEYGTTYVLEATGGVLGVLGDSLQNPDSSRFTTAPKPPLVLASVTPPAASVGACLILSGQGFDPSPANNTVLFNGAAVPPTSAGVDYLSLKVPLAAITGPIRVVSGGDTTNAAPFVVLVPSMSPVDEVVATVGTGNSTNSVAVTPDGAIAYSVSPDGDIVIPIDIGGLATYPSISVGDNPVAIAIHPEGTYAYVVNFGSGSVSIIVVDPDSAAFNTVVQTILVGTNPLDVAVNPDGDRVYVANAGSSSLSVIDGDNSSATHHQVLATISTGSSAKSVAVTPDGAVVYVGTGAGYSIVDAETNAVVGAVSTGSSTKSVAVTPDGALLIILTAGGDILVVDVQEGSPTENQVLATISAGTTTKSVAVSPDGALLYIILEDSDEVIVYALTIVAGASVFEPGVIIPPTRVEVSPIDTIPAGSDPAYIAFDPSGSGLAIICSAGDRTVIILNASSVPIGPLSAAVTVTPHTLNLRSNGRWVSGRIELPAAFFPEEIALASVLLQNAIPADPERWTIEDCDADGIRELVCKFDRALFQAMLPQGEYVPVTITGNVRNRTFEGLDTIRTIRPTVKHPTGCVVTMGEITTILWTSPAGIRVDAVNVHWSPDDGETWFPVAEAVPDEGGVPWRAPETEHANCRVLVTLLRDGEILGMGISPDPFTVSVPVAVTVAGFSAVMRGEEAAIRWSTQTESGVDGFNVLRADREDGLFERIGGETVPARGGADGGEYEVRDTEVSLNRTYYYELERVSRDGSRVIAGPFRLDVRAPFDLAQNVPNPFNPTTLIKFTIAEDCRVTLVVYDASGRRVRSLVARDLPAAFYRIEWDGRNDEGRRLSSGVYFYRLNAGRFTKTRKLVLLR